MNITKNKKNIPSQSSHSLRNHSLLIISSDYSVESLYQILSKNPLLINQKDNKGGTLLSYSIERNKQDIFDLILTSPILDLDYQDKEGNSYLHIAVQFEREKMIKELIEKGISLNIQNNDGNTPLHLAYFTRNKKIINYLIQNNIDCTIKNNNGEIAEQNSINNYESNKFDENPLMNDNIMNDSEINVDNYSSNKNENDDSEINESIKIEWSGSNLMKKNRQFNLSIPNNCTSIENLKSYQMINKKKKDENNTDDTKSNSPKYINSLKQNENNNIFIEKEPNYFNISSSIENQRYENNDKINIKNNYNICEDEDLVNFNFNRVEKMKRFNTTNLFHPKNIATRKNSSNTTSSNLILIKPKIEVNDNFRFSSPYHKNNKEMTESFKINESKRINSSQIMKYSIQNIHTNPNPQSSTIINNKNIHSNIIESSNSNQDLLLFLQSINLEKYYKNFISNGFDDIKLIINQTKTDLGITENNLKEAGIFSSGDRAKIIIKVQELAGNFSYQIPKEVYYTCDNFDNIEKDKNISKLNNWLKEINVETLLSNFISNGYHSLELLLIQLESKEPLSVEKLKNDLGIDIIGFRQRIYNKLKDDKRKFIGRLRQNLIITENRNNDICHDCHIF